MSATIAKTRTMLAELLAAAFTEAEDLLCRADEIESETRIAEGHLEAIERLQAYVEGGSDPSWWAMLATAVVIADMQSWGEGIWISPRTQHYLDDLTGAPEAREHFRELASMIIADQTRLAGLLIHLDDAAIRLQAPANVVKDLALRGALSFTEIDGVTFIIEDQALHAAEADLSSWMVGWPS